MPVKSVGLNCRGCNNPLSIDDKECKYCGGPVTISTFNSVSGMSMPLVNKYANSYRRDLSENPYDMDAHKSAAYCFFKLGLYDKALEHFEKALENNFDDSELYFYAAICLLSGNIPFLCVRTTINKIEEYLNAAVMIEPKGVYYYYWAYIKYDYYKRKFLNTSPDYINMLGLSKQYGISDLDKKELFMLIKDRNPFEK